MPQEFDVEVFADYHQFYVQDGGIFPDAPVDWTEEDMPRRVKVADNVVVICPIRNMTVPVRVEIHDAEPALEFTHYDHVVRCSLDLPTGKLQVHECTGAEVLACAITPGNYAVVALFSGLDTVDDTGLEGDDAYRVVLWPISAPLPLVVSKAWVENQA